MPCSLVGKLQLGLLTPTPVGTGVIPGQALSPALDLQVRESHIDEHLSLLLGCWLVSNAVKVWQIRPGGIGDRHPIRI